MIAPLGSGGFPPEAGSHDSPKWQPGRWPLTVWPVIGFNGDLWGWSQTNAWSSGDGLHWTHYRKTDTGEVISTTHVFFNGRLWMFGGLRYKDRAPVNDIWSSVDGKVWQKAGTGEWSPRKSTSVAVFKNRLWLFGGADQVKPDFSTVHSLADVWTSTDGTHWTQVTAAAPWSPREDANVLVRGGSMYLVGGGALADVWRTEDGVHWAQLTAQAGWQPRNGFGAVVFDGKFWVYGGSAGTSTNALNDIWYSTDGHAWVRQTEHAPWGPRSPRTTVYRGKLWIFSGKHTGGSDNWGGDIWTMSLRKYSVGLR
jgi:hypothetical protein